ncbi:MAG: phosphoglycerate mutase, partial [Candidatus Bathyarchaeota archaeon]
MVKLIYVVIDGLGDLPVEELEHRTPLDAAETPNMDYLAEHGKTGKMYTVGKGIAPESDVAVISILGYDPFKYATGRGVLEAIGVGVDVKDGDLALRCNFATLGVGNEIVDRRVGRDLTTKEAGELSLAVNKNV